MAESRPVEHSPLPKDLQRPAQALPEGQEVTTLLTGGTLGFQPCKSQRNSEVEGLASRDNSLLNSSPTRAGIVIQSVKLKPSTLPSYLKSWQFASVSVPCRCTWDSI